MPLITLKTYDNFSDAHIAKAKLESEGIYCFVPDNDLVKYTMHQQIIYKYVLKVNKSDAEAALKILGEVERASLTNEKGEVVTCEKCGSNQFYSHFYSVKGKSRTMAFLITAFHGLFPFFIKTVYKCKACGHAFKKVA